MSSQSVVSICNISLLSIGAQAQISNLNEGSTESDACSQLFSFVYEMLARAAYWNCLTQENTLTLLQAAAGTPENPQGTTLPLPPQPWLYSYQLPSDCLAARYVLPIWPTQPGSVISPAYVMAPPLIPGQGQIPFKVAYGTDANGNPRNVILTNQTQAQLVYTVNQPNPIIWDSAFTSAMVASLAAWLVPALSLNATLMAGQAKKAEMLVTEARIRDANEGSNSQDHIPDWMLIRNSGGNGYGGWPNTSVYGNNWGGLAWPAGY